MSKKKKTLSLTALFLTMYFLLLSLFFFSFFSLLLALTHTVLQDCTGTHTLGLYFFSSPLQMAECLSFYFIIFSFFFSLSHSSHLVTINASTQALLLYMILDKKDEFNSSLHLAEFPCVFFSQFFFFL